MDPVLASLLDRLELLLASGLVSAFRLARVLA
jgi:hypothetical protein